MDRDHAIVTIADRLSTGQNADRIYTPENGEIIEKGTHGKLLETDEEYAEMYAIQSRGEDKI
jgi:subfamily B ATP-binding cassette protein MsbA